MLSKLIFTPGLKMPATVYPTMPAIKAQEETLETLRTLANEGFKALYREANLQLDVVSLKERVTNAEAYVQSMSADNTALKEEATALQSRVHEAEDKVKNICAERSLLKQHFVDLHTQAAATEEKLQIISAQLATTSIEFEAQKAANDTLATTVSTLQVEHDLLTESRRLVEKERLDIFGELQAARAKIGCLEDALAKAVAVNNARILRLEAALEEEWTINAGLSDELQEARGELVSAMAKNATLKQELSLTMETASMHQAQLNEIRRDYQQLQTERTDLIYTIRGLERKLDSADKSLVCEEDARAALTSKHLRLEADHSIQVAAFNAQSAELNEVKKILAELQYAVAQERAEFRAALDASEYKVGELTSENASLKEQVLQLVSDKDALESMVATKVADWADKDAQLMSKADGVIETIQNKVAALLSENAKLQSVIQDRDDQIASTGKQLKRECEAHQETYEDLAAVQGRFASLTATAKAEKHKLSTLEENRRLVKEVNDACSAAVSSKAAKVKAPTKISTANTAATLRRAQDKENRNESSAQDVFLATPLRKKTPRSTIKDSVLDHVVIDMSNSSALSVFGNDKENILHTPAHGGKSFTGSVTSAGPSSPLIDVPASVYLNSTTSLNSDVVDGMPTRFLRFITRRSVREFSPIDSPV